MVAAVAAAWAVMAAGLYLLLENFVAILGEPSAADGWHGLPESLRGTAIVITQTWSGWLVWLLVVGMPVAVAVTYRRWRSDAADETVTRRRWLTRVVLGVAGCLATIALLLAVDAHARRGSVRWSLDYVAGLGFFDEQAIVVVVAAICALIVAARAEIRGGRRALGGARGRGGGGRRPGAAQRVEHRGTALESLSVEYAPHPDKAVSLTSVEESGRGARFRRGMGFHEADRRPAGPAPAGVAEAFSCRRSASKMIEGSSESAGYG